MQALLIRQREKFDVFGRKHPKEIKRVVAAARKWRRQDVSLL